MIKSWEYIKIKRIIHLRIILPQRYQSTFILMLGLLWTLTSNFWPFYLLYSRFTCESFVNETRILSILLKSWCLWWVIFEYGTIFTFSNMITQNIYKYNNLCKLSFHCQSFCRLLDAVRWLVQCGLKIPIEVMLENINSGLCSLYSYEMRYMTKYQYRYQLWN